MKYTIYSLILCVIISSCDLPQRTTTIHELSDFNTNSTIGNNSNSGNSSATNGSENSSSNTVSSSVGFSHCTNTFPYNGQQIGMFNLCPHSSDESRFQAIFQTGSSQGVCFVPNHRLANGTSFKLGRAECVYNQANIPYQMTLNKELLPPNFTSTRTERINSVMVLRADAASAYMSCMNAKNAYLVSARQVPGNYASPPCCYNPVSYQGNPYCMQVNPSCDQAANNYANSVCSSFVQNYSGKYKEIIL